MSRKQSIPNSWWFNATMLLSLDFVDPFISMVGLDATTAPEFKQLLRGYIRQYRRACEANPNYHASMEPDDILKWLREQGREDFTKQLRWWIENLYAEEPRDHLDLDSWTIVLRALRKQNLFQVLRLDSEKTAFVRDAFDVSTNRDEYYEKVEQIEKHRLSDWDLHLYVINYWNDDLADAPNGPLSFLYPIVSAHSAYSFWNSVTMYLGEEQINTLWKNANSHVIESQDLRFIESLVNPRVLRLQKL